jgi:hypothetical protein
VIPTQLGFVDIAGLVKGASKGEGLGNQFLGNIREVDAIVHVLRCFEDDDIQHVANKVDPISDADVVETELMLSDLESLEKRVPAAAKKATGGDKEAKIMASVLGQALELLREGQARAADRAEGRRGSARVRAGAAADRQAGALRLQRRRGRCRQRQRAQRAGLRQGRPRKAPGGRGVGGDRERDRRHGGRTSAPSTCPSWA